ncbi:MAG: 5,10-methenyltetrahydrofolate synthetase, partial [Thermoproteota archaeon]
MTLRYEINPPKVIQDKLLSHEPQRSLDDIKQRIINISKNCNGIHITDSVLGIPRVSPLTLAAL